MNRFNAISVSQFHLFAICLSDEHSLEYWIMDQFEDLGIKYVLITCHVPSATADVWTTLINMGLGFMELTF